MGLQINLGLQQELIVLIVSLPLGLHPSSLGPSPSPHFFFSLFHIASIVHGRNPVCHRAQQKPTLSHTLSPSHTIPSPLPFPFLSHSLTLHLHTEHQPPPQRGTRRHHPPHPRRAMPPHSPQQRITLPSEFFSLFSSSSSSLFFVHFCCFPSQSIRERNSKKN